MPTIDLSRRVGPFVGVAAEKIVRFPEAGRAFRVVLYGAYDAFGLIGSECNGIAVLDEDERRVVCDEIAKEPTGYFGPSEAQLACFAATIKLKYPEFRQLVNGSPRARMKL